MIVVLAALAGTLASLLAATVAAFLVAWDRRDKRDVLEREASRGELQLLLNRIQAPDTAVAQTLTVPSAGALDLDSDTDYWTHLNEQAQSA